MLERLLRHINNRFDRDPRGAAYGSASGTFTAAGGTLDVPGLKDGQWFWVEGSVLNDGLHQYPPTDMRDEEFDGDVVFLAIPREVEDLAAEISEWCESNADAISGPYQSESFGGYSYTKASTSQDGGAAEPWHAQFAARLRPFRKLSRDWV